MTQPPDLEFHISPNNGSGWYWEVVNKEHEVVARGLADTHHQARVDAMSAGQAQRPWETLQRKSA
jgi:hypothetical protein